MAKINEVQESSHRQDVKTEEPFSSGQLERVHRVALRARSTKRDPRIALEAFLRKNEKKDEYPCLVEAANTVLALLEDSGNQAAGAAKAANGINA